MDFNPTLNDVLYTPKQLAVKEDFYKRLNKLEAQRRETDPEFSISALRIYDLIQYNGQTTIRIINSEIDPELLQEILSITEQVGLTRIK